MWDTIVNGFKDILDWFANFPTMLGDFFDYWFNPNSEQLEGKFDVGAKFDDKFVFVHQFKNAINNLNSTGKPLQLPVVEVFGYKIDVNAKLFEPYAPKIRAGISTLFWVLCALSIWRMISGVFNIGVNNVAGNVASDIVPRKGGKS